MAAGVAVRRDFFAEKDAENGDRGADYGHGGFDRGPDCDIFAVVGEVCLPQLDYVDAFYDGADTGSVMTLVLRGFDEVGAVQETHAHGDADTDFLAGAHSQAPD